MHAFQVMSTLTDWGSNWKSWNPPFIRELEGPKQRGGNMRALLQPVGHSKAQEFTPRILTLTDSKVRTSASRGHLKPSRFSNHLKAKLVEQRVNHSHSLNP
jgi:hypothetical protein